MDPICFPGLLVMEVNPDRKSVAEPLRWSTLIAFPEFLELQNVTHCILLDLVSLGWGKALLFGQHKASIHCYPSLYSGEFIQYNLLD